MTPTSKNASFPFLVIAVFVLSNGWTWQGCKTDSESGPQADPCDSVTCSGHGTCVVLDGSTPLCMCDPGYAAADGDTLNCREVPAGQECEDVTCSGHGTCVVADGDPKHPICLCDVGYHLVGQTTCEANAGEGSTHACNSNQDCSNGTVCMWNTGECAEASDGLCRMPESAGTRALGELCVRGSNPESDCQQGLVCMTKDIVLNPSTGFYERISQGGGICMKACNPCETGSCGDGECIGLGSGGGFCHDGPLAEEGDTCVQPHRGPSGGPVAKLCEAGTTCEALFVDYKCVRHCTPNDPAAWEERHIHYTFDTDFESDDCPSGQACVLVSLSLYGNQWACTDGSSASRGETCGQRPLPLCKWPDLCLNKNATNPNRIVPATCSSPEGCTTDENCPAGAHCLFAGSTTTPMPACVFPHNIGYDGYCEGDEDCMPGLTCKRSTYPQDTALHCLL